MYEICEVVELVILGEFTCIMWTWCLYVKSKACTLETIFWLVGMLVCCPLGGILILQ